MIPVLATERLTLRGPRAADFEAVADFLGSERARYVGGRRSRREAWLTFAGLVGHWELRGYGMWTWVEKDTASVVGRGGLWNPLGWPQLEVGWMLGRPYWGRGYATEVGRAALALAWAGLAPDWVCSVIHPDNQASQAVARRLLAHKSDPKALPPDVPFAELDALAAHLDRLDPQTLVLLTFLPVFVTSLPPQGSAAALRDAACKERARRIAERRPNTALLNLEGDNALARDVASYVDDIHFRGDVARKVELEIARALVALQSRVK